MTSAPLPPAGRCPIPVDAAVPHPLPTAALSHSRSDTHFHAHAGAGAGARTSLVRRALASLGLALVLGVGSGLMPASAHAAQTLIPAQSEIVFVSTQMGVPVEGRFRQFDAQVNFDPADLAASRVSLEVATGSATVGVKETDAELPKPTWFNVAAFPKASFQSGAIKATGPGRYEISGRLSIKGLTRDVVVPVTMTQSGGTTVATGTLAIPRLGFKIGENEWADTSMVADEVKIRFKLALNGVGPLPAR